jgi:uncharacterized protein (TIGR02246 family)
MANLESQPNRSQSQDSAEIEALVAIEIEAWNRGDAKAFATRFAPDGGFTNVLGMVYYGREAFEQRHAEILKTIFKGSVLRQSIGKLRFIRPDVAVVDVDGEMTGYASLPPGIRTAADGVLRFKLQMVLVREKGEWWITAYHNVAVTPLPLPDARMK